MKNWEWGCFLGIKIDYNVYVIKGEWYWCVDRQKDECKGVKDPVKSYGNNVWQGVFQVT